MSLEINIIAGNRDSVSRNDAFAVVEVNPDPARKPGQRREKLLGIVPFYEIASRAEIRERNGGDLLSSFRAAVEAVGFSDPVLTRTVARHYFLRTAEGGPRPS